MQQWIYDGVDKNSPHYSVNTWGEVPYPEVEHLHTPHKNTEISNELLEWFNSINPILQALLSDGKAVNLTSVAMQITKALEGMDRGYTSMDGLAMVVATIFSDILTDFAWEYKEIEGKLTRQGPVRWEIYGSGPQLRWQWAIAAVMGVNIVVQLVDMHVLVFWRLEKGRWLGLAGMLVAANSAEKMAPIRDDQGAGFVTEDVKFTKFFVREKGQAEDQRGVATLTSEGQRQRFMGEKLTKGYVYGKKEE